MKTLDSPGPNRKKAVLLISLFGAISLLGDVIYEGARSVNGPYLNTLGANAALVGLIVGIGELLGYGIRLISGYYSDKTRAYWLFTIVGYGMLMAIPLLSLTGIWQVAAVLMVLERVGKGLRSPARDTIVSHATKQVGTGFGFGVLEFLDQIGAMAGPLIFTLFFLSVGASQKTVADYQAAYGLLWLPFLMLLGALFYAYYKVRNPEELEASDGLKREPDNVTKVFWLYTLFTFVTTAGFANYAIIGYHLKANGIVSDAQIPLLYTVAMGVDAVMALAVGKAYDRLKAARRNERAGLLVLAFIPLLTAALVPFVFSYDAFLVLVGMVLWGMVMGSHETVMKASIADIMPIKKRGTAYGVYNVVYGLALFAGSVIAGYLYDISVQLMGTGLILIEIASLPLFFWMRKEVKAVPKAG